jgi:hypothetical protein
MQSGLWGKMKRPRPGPEIQSGEAIALATVAGLALIECECSQAVWSIEIVAAIILSLWIVIGKFWVGCRLSSKGAGRSYRVR